MLMLMLHYTEVERVTSGHINTNNAHLSNQTCVRI
jgi:hypothetical protein